jgi:hypothetical protein
MWMLDDKLYTYEAYQQAKHQLDQDVAKMRRVWVGWMKEEPFKVDVIEVNPFSKWIFEDAEKEKGYQEVKRYNNFVI